MENTAFRRKPGALIFAMAGLQAGIVGLIWMFACFLVAALWGGGGIWSVPNLFATAFYGENVWQNEFFSTTWSGIALLVVLYGLLGMAWGSLWKLNRIPLLSLYGSLTGLGVYYLLFNYVWTHTAPVIPLYAPLRQMQVAHILWGASLAKSPVYSARIARALTPQPPPSAPPGGGNEDAGLQDSAAEIVSGELIQ